MTMNNFPIKFLENLILDFAFKIPGFRSMKKISSEGLFYHIEKGTVIGALNSYFGCQHTTNAACDYTIHLQC